MPCANAQLTHDDTLSIGSRAIKPLKVAYLLLNFSRLTETLVAEGVEVIRSRNIDMRIISLLLLGFWPVQPPSQQLLQYTWNASAC